MFVWYRRRQKVTNAVVFSVKKKTVMLADHAHFAYLLISLYIMYSPLRNALCAINNFDLTCQFLQHVDKEHYSLRSSN